MKTTTLSDAKLAELKDSAAHILADCRRKLLAQFPFTGSVVMGMNIIPVRDNRVPTACTDGTNIYFSIGFLASLKPEERIFVLAHEIWHAVMAHMTRESKRDHNLANQAEDVEVNELLMAEGLSCPKDACTCATMNLPKGKSFEEYYEILVNRKKDYGGDEGDGNSDPSEGGNAPSGGTGNQSTAGQFDKHIHKGDDMEADKGDESMTDKYGSVGKDNDYTPEINENLAEKLREAVISAAQQVERSRGEMPGHLKQIVNKLLTPQIDWKEQLASFISKSNGEGRTNWSSPNKRLYSSGIYLPSRIGEQVNIGVVVDTSGSCVEDITKFLTEVNGIVKAFGNYQLSLCQCDWDVRSFDTYDESKPLDLENTKFEVKSGGGTRMLPGLQSFAARDVPVDCIICFTDGECEDINEGDVDAPIMWVCVTKGPHENLKCGVEVQFKDNKGHL